MQRDSFTVSSFPDLSAFQSDGAGRLRVCIATEEIVGPVRNGGIASTYYHLARGLAAEGHDVTICYLKGREVENETPEHWIDYYAQFGISFVPLPNRAKPIAGASVRWQSRWLAFHEWLLASERFDVVHSSEWRGGAFYALQAKRLGLAFADTLFVTKTSSPYIWNRHYQMQPIDNVDLLIASFAEQKCVEWADIVVGGSAHLLSFMEHIGYKLPEGRTYVQPNIVDFREINVPDARPAREFGDVVHSRELVFFGRLEPRKGLDLFVLAIDLLVAQGAAIDRITFLGKPGEPLAGQGGLQPLDFIAKHAENWPIPIDIVTDLNQPEALSLMCSRDMIAAMPSVIENSTMAVYEALVHKIPFIATDVGGTSELIAGADHEAVLVPPSVEPLAQQLATVLVDGQRLARPDFDNDANLANWYGFHRYLAQHGPGSIVASFTPDPTPADRIAAILYAPTLEALDEALEQARTSDGIDQITVYCGEPIPEKKQIQIDGQSGGNVSVIEAIGASPGGCFNRAMAETDCEILLFQHADRTEFLPQCAALLGKAIAAQSDALVTGLVSFASNDDGKADTLFAPLGADPAAQSLTGAAYGLEVVAGRKALFEAIGPFEEYRVPRGTVHEYVTRAANENRDLFVIAEPLFSIGHDYGWITEQSGHAAYLAHKALVDAGTLPAKKLLLHKPAAVRAPGNSGQIVIGRAHREDDQTAWLTNVEKLGKLSDPPPNRHNILLGFQRETGLLEFAVLHSGALTITANGQQIRNDSDFGSRDNFTQDSLPLLPLIGDSDRLRLRIEFQRGEQLKFASILAQRLEDQIYFLSARSPIYWDGDFAKMLALIGGRPSSPAIPALRKLRARAPSLIQRIRQR